MTSIGPIRRDDLNNFLVNSSLTLQYAFLTGFLLGGYSAAQRASLQFLAETQHEVPQTKAQALQYHRDKNYRMMAGFGTGGVKRGGQLAADAGGYLAVKKGLEVARKEINSGPSEHFDDMIAGSIVGSSFFLLSDKRQKLFHFKKGLLLGSAFGTSLSLIKYINHRLSTSVKSQSNLLE